MPKQNKKIAKGLQSTDYSEKAVVSSQSAVSHALKGLVVAAKLSQTVTVLVERSKMHPLYHKAIKQSKRYLVHDTVGVKEGDLVEIVQIKPISKHKTFKVLKVVGQDMATIVSEELKEDVAEAIAEVMPVETSEVSESADASEVSKSASQKISSDSADKADLAETPKKARAKKEAK